VKQLISGLAAYLQISKPKPLRPISKYFSKNRAVYEKIWKKYCRVVQATDDNTAHALHGGYVKLQTHTRVV
jgi:hypothetical protein